MEKHKIIVSTSKYQTGFLWEKKCFDYNSNKLVGKLQQFVIFFLTSPRSLLLALTSLPASIRHWAISPSWKSPFACDRAVSCSAVLSSLENKMNTVQQVFLKLQFFAT